MRAYLWQLESGIKYIVIHSNSEVNMLVHAYLLELPLSWLFNTCRVLKAICKTFELYLLISLLRN